MCKQQIDRILGKVKRLGLKLDPIISEESLVKIEKELNVLLPETYKIYLTKIQNGGISDKLHEKAPYYGIYPIEKSIEENQEWEIDLTQKFQLTEDLEYGELYNAETDWEKHTWRCENDEQYQADIQRVLYEYQNSSMLEGTLPICEYGCGDFFRLVVTGAKAGEIWVDSGVINDTGFYSLNVDILTFFENWLDRQIEILSDPTRKLVNAHYSFLEFGNNKRYKLVE